LTEVVGKKKIVVEEEEVCIDVEKTKGDKASIYGLKS